MSSSKKRQPKDQTSEGSPAPSRRLLSCVARLTWPAEPTSSISGLLIHSVPRFLQGSTAASDLSYLASPICDLCRPSPSLSPHLSLSLSLSLSVCVCVCGIQIDICLTWYAVAWHRLCKNDRTHITDCASIYMDITVDNRMTRDAPRIVHIRVARAQAHTYTHKHTHTHTHTQTQTQTHTSESPGG